MSVFTKPPIPIDIRSKLMLPRSGDEALMEVRSDRRATPEYVPGTNRIVTTVTVHVDERDARLANDKYLREVLADAIEMCRTATDSELCRALWHMRRRLRGRKRIRSMPNGM